MSYRLARLWHDGVGPAALLELREPHLPSLPLADAVAEAQVELDQFEAAKP